ncbi:uncharacterized protein PG998_000891 [Apiospora kogelbergensis]|uniref:uncharacterized protein n=1 Tax=Apiospora kogelbergensis TaxID=1337665 RepID=UPI00313138AC
MERSTIMERPPSPIITPAYYPEAEVSVYEDEEAREVEDADMAYAENDEDDEVFVDRDDPDIEEMEKELTEEGYTLVDEVVEEGED